MTRKRHATGRLVRTLIVLMLLGGCGQSTPTASDAPTDDESTVEPESSPATAESQASYPMTVTACGKDVVITNEPERVVVENTAVAEILHALGVGDRIISQFIDPNLVDALPEYRDEIAAIPSLGGATGSDHAPSKEVLLAEEADLVVWSFPRSIDSEGTVTTADLNAVGSAVIPLSYACPDSSGLLTIDDQLNDVLLLGTAFGVEDRANELVDDMREELADVQERVEGLERPSVATFYFAGDSVSPYGGGIPDEIVRLAGGENVWSGATEAGQMAVTNISNEAFASRPAEVFVITNLSGIATGAPGPEEAFELVSERFPDMPASQNERWVEVSGHAQQPSLVAIRAVVDVAKTLHPEAF